MALALRWVLDKEKTAESTWKSVSRLYELVGSPELLLQNGAYKDASVSL